MAVNIYWQKLADFTQRIKEAFLLEEDPDNIIPQRRLALAWLNDELARVRQKKEDLSNASGIAGLLLKAGLNSSKIKDLQTNEFLLTGIKENIKGPVIDLEETEIDKVGPPEDIRRCLHAINKRRLPEYFGIAHSPFFKNCYVKSKEGYEKCIRNSLLNNLKCTSLGSDSGFIIKSQRYSLEQLLNHLFHDTAELSTVLKIETESRSSDKPIEIYCWIEDTECRPKLYRPLSALKTDENTFNLYLQQGNVRLFVDEVSLLHCFLTQLLVVPVQTVISDYVLTQHPHDPTLLTVSKLQGASEEKDLFFYMREHPSLRNPLVYFYSFIKYYSFDIQQLITVLEPTALTSRFYQILSVLSRFIRNDFTLKHNDQRAHSLCIDEAVVNIIWSIFQEVLILAGWLQEVISPIKDTVTVAEIKSKLYPIFNEIAKVGDITYLQYRTLMLKSSIQSSLTVNVSKINIEKYKDRYVSLNSIKYSPIKDKADVYRFFFAKTMSCHDLRNSTPHQSLYFLNFIARNYWGFYRDATQPIHPSWRSKKIWKEVVQLRNKQFEKLPYISVCLDLLALHLGFDSIQHCAQPFECIKNDYDEDQLLEVVVLLMKVLMQSFIKKREEYLSLLIQKCFKFKKYKAVRILMESGAEIKNYQDIFAHAKTGSTMASKLQRFDEKNRLIEEMKTCYPEMYRKYQWEELINAKLKQEDRGNEHAVLRTVGKGTFHVKKQVYAQLTSKNVMGNSISRKDYMFCNNRLIAKIAVEEVEAYVEFTEYPLIKYFYSFFLKKIAKDHLALNFCSFFSEKGVLFHLIECIPQCFTFEKGLEMHSEKELKNYIKEDEISEAIIISMILMPTNIQLKNIIVSLSSSLRSRKEEARKSLFIVDFHDFYQKNGFELNGGHAVLKVKNSLFLFEEMGNSISARLIKKYAELNVVDIVSSLFKMASTLITQANSSKPKPLEEKKKLLEEKKNKLEKKRLEEKKLLLEEEKKLLEEEKQLKEEEKQLREEQKQLLSIIFQKGYAFRLAERMCKVRAVLEKKIKLNLSVDHFELLEAIDPQLRYYYEELLRSEHNLLEREKMMMQDTYGKPLLITNKLVSFIAAGAELDTDFDTFPNHYIKFSFEGPAENLKHLNEREDQLSVYSDKLKDLQDYSHATIEYFVRNVDLSQYEKEEREETFSKLQQYSNEYLDREKNCLPLSVIRVTHIEGLKEKHMKFGCERLRDVIFEDLSCSESDLNSLIKKYENGSNLLVRKVRGIERVGQSLMGLGGMLEIKNIKRLSITECPQLSTIDIKCDQLENAILRNNCNLTHIYINSKKLMNLDCSQCSKLRLENIGIYIFMKCNVLLCSNSCDGDVKRLEDKNYSIFLTRILRYLFNRFHSENLYKLDLALTLNKLELIDEKYYMFGSTRFNPSGLANNLSFITKAGTEALRITQQQIIELFMKNEFIDVLSIDEMLKVQLECLRVAVNYLKTTKVVRPLKELIFREIIKTPELFNQLMGNVFAMFEVAKVQKTLTLRLALVPQIDIRNYIQLLQIVNQKASLERLQLVIENSEIENEFVEYAFNLSTESKVCKLLFSHCTFLIDEKVAFEPRPAVREVQLLHCKLSNLRFIEKFVNATHVKLENCTILNLVAPIYSSLGTLNKLRVLELVNLKQNLFERRLELGLLFKELGRMGSLEQLNFSGNRMDREELKLFSAKISSVRLYEITLYDFYEPQADLYIKNFLHHDCLKIIHIEFTLKQHSESTLKQPSESTLKQHGESTLKQHSELAPQQHSALLQSFFDQLAHNSSVIKLKLKTDEEVKSLFFEKLKPNKKLQHIHSNQPIPTWFKNCIAANVQLESSVFQSEPYELLIPQSSKKQDFYRVGLSLDGGGVRGLLLATQLDYLSRQVNQPLHRIFDCIGGTSIGGILSLASTGTLDGNTPICNTRDLMDIFELYGNKIFKKSQMQQLTSLFDTKYDITSFEELLYSKFKDAKLSETLRGTQVVVTAVNRLTNEEVIFRSIYSIFDRNKDFYMRDIARATSAAPIYFPSAEIKNLNATEKFSLIDGGVGLNNPSKLVIDDIIKLAQNEENKKNYFLLSLGTGKMKNEAIPSKAGMVNIEPIIDGFTVAANCFIEKDMTENYRGHYLRVSPLVNLPRKDAELDNTRPEILKVYKEAGLVAAEEEFSNKISYGKFRDRSLVEWLQENTARKMDF